MRYFRIFCFILLFAGSLASARAFSLLGPFAPWMAPQLSYRDGISIGGPMDIGQGYRWNIPIITYGFDQSFLDYFGTNGVNAVESAIELLNVLPPASVIVLSNYPLFTARSNFRAQSQNLIDLKSMTLALLLEQLGLTQPSHFVFSLRNFSSLNGQIDYTSIMRNFDPESLAPADYVNGVTYGGFLIINGMNTFNYVYSTNDPPLLVDMSEATIDPQDPSETAVADSEPGGILDDTGLYNKSGQFFTGLSRDDAGGLRYLLNPTNVAMESLISGIRSAGTNSQNYVDRAARPGVDKITFLRMDHAIGSNQFVPITYQYADTYFVDNVPRQQTLLRTVQKPDISFSVKDNRLNYISQTGTTNWVNNGLPSQDGPGVIQPPIEIDFKMMSPVLDHFGATFPDPPNTIFEPLILWGSFDSTTNLPILYPVDNYNANSSIFHLRLDFVHPWEFDYLDPAGSSREFSWAISGSLNDVSLLQTSTDLTNWITISTITNLGSPFTFIDSLYGSTPRRFYRTVLK